MDIFSSFHATKEYDHFVAECEACRHYRYISLCVGGVGVGKTSMARRYTSWDVIEPLLSWHGSVLQPLYPSESPLVRAAYYRPRVDVTARQVEQDLALLWWGMQQLPDTLCQSPESLVPQDGRIRPGGLELLLVDDANRLSMAGFDVLADVAENHHTGLLLLGLGLPPLELRLAKIPKIAAGIGSVYHIRTLKKEEMCQLLQEQFHMLHLTVETEAMDVLWEKTQGNFKTLGVLIANIDRLLRVNRKTSVVTAKVVQFAYTKALAGKRHRTGVLPK